MKAEFQAKFLQNFVSKKKGTEGFTLIELLVVIIIVGVLAAIALPSFLNQIGKARGSEAKSNIGTINRGLQAYRLENNTMTNAISNLDAKISGSFYAYSLSGASSNIATVNTTTQRGDLKSYSGAVNQNGDTFQAIICESQNTVATNIASTAPTNATTCAATTKQVN
jgi:type IV pilus assembly protein PilA